MAKGAYIGVPTAQGIGNLEVGSIVKLKVNGTPKEFIIVHQGNPDGNMYDGSCNGTWLLMKDIYEKRTWHSSNFNEYSMSTIHSYLNNGFLALFDNNIRSVIKEVKIPYMEGVGSGSIGSGSSGLSAKVFLLSGYEVGFTQSQSNNSKIPIDGACLSYFSGFSAQDSRRIGYYGGSASTWWLRSAYTENIYSACTVYTNGGRGNINCSESTNGIRPAMILPSTLACDGNGLITGAEGELKPIARKVKKGYIGIEGLARKIKKAYIGIGGVARPCWSGGELAYYGTITALSQARYGLAATSIGDYALFGGGRVSQQTSAVDSYDKSLVRNTATSLSQAVDELAATSIGSYALFGGGRRAGNGKVNYINAYNTSLTQSLKYLGTARYWLAATTVGNNALFGGGFATNTTNVVDAVNTSLSVSTATSLSAKRTELAATTVGDHALFGGGNDGNGSGLSVVDAYNTSLTRTIETNLSVGRMRLAATTVGNYALFGGGYSGNSNNCYATVDAYDTSLTRTTPTVLSVARYYLAATSVGEYAVFGGGDPNTGTYSSVYDVYDTSLTRTTLSHTATWGMERHAATTVGNYALFGGGNSNDDVTTRVHALIVA